MKTKQGQRKVLNLGEFVAATYDLGSSLAPDADIAADLVAGHLGRTLIRTGNKRLVVALAALGRELESTRTSRSRSRRITAKAA